MPSDIFMSQGQTVLFTTAAVCMITHPTLPGLYISKMSAEIVDKEIFFFFHLFLDGSSTLRKKKGLFSQGSGDFIDLFYL